MTRGLKSHPDLLLIADLRNQVFKTPPISETSDAKAILRRGGVSTRLAALILAVSEKAVEKWVRGATKPSGVVRDKQWRQLLAWSEAQAS